MEPKLYLPIDRSSAASCRELWHKQSQVVSDSCLRRSQLDLALAYCYWIHCKFQFEMTNLDTSQPKNVDLQSCCSSL